jgi:hypothetical protein
VPWSPYDQGFNLCVVFSRAIHPAQFPLRHPIVSRSSLIVTFCFLSLSIFAIEAPSKLPRHASSKTIVQAISESVRSWSFESGQQLLTSHSSGRIANADHMWKIFYLIPIFMGSLNSTPAQTIPNELFGRWIVRRELPAGTISCWSEKEARGLIGTVLEYSSESFRWKAVVTKNPIAEVRIVTAAQFHDANSGRGLHSSQVTFRQLGIKADKAMQVTIQHPMASISGATDEIPGDSMLIKDKNTIIFSVCNVYFEAKRRSSAIEN